VFREAVGNIRASRFLSPQSMVDGRLRAPPALRD
jgi:hypothetical protein